MLPQESPDSLGTDRALAGWRHPSEPLGLRQCALLAAARDGGWDVHRFAIFCHRAPGDVYAFFLEAVDDGVIRKHGLGAS